MGAEWVRLDFPPKFKIGIPEFAERCGWRLRSSDGVWFVCTNESYLNRPSQLLQTTRLADASSHSKQDLHSLTEWLPQDDIELPHDAIDLHIKNALARETENDSLYALLLSLVRASDDEIAKTLSEAFGVSFSRTMPSASVFAVKTTSELHHRLTAMRVLAGARLSPEVMDRENFAGFKILSGIAGAALYGMDAYAAPLLLWPAPWLLGLHATRVGGHIVISFGFPKFGRDPKTPIPELIELHSPGNHLSRPIDTTQRPPQLTQAQCESAIRWWFQRVSTLFGSLLDPAKFIDSAGTYDPVKQLATFVSVDRVFACLHHVLHSTRRDEFTRKLMLFHAIDVLEGLSIFGNREKMLTLSNLRRTVAMIAASLPEETKPVFLPRCEGALAAVDRLTQGFVLSERVKDRCLSIVSDKGQSQLISLETAAARLLGIVRNSSHSFRKTIEEKSKLSILSAHDSELPNGIADVVAVYALRILADPRILVSR